MLTLIKFQSFKLEIKWGFSTQRIQQKHCSQIHFLDTKEVQKIYIFKIQFIICL